MRDARIGATSLGEYLGAAQVAKLLDCTPDNVRRLLRDGAIPFVWVANRRVMSRADVEAFRAARNGERPA